MLADVIKNPATLKSVQDDVPTLGGQLADIDPDAFGHALWHSWAAAQASPAW